MLRSSWMLALLANTQSAARMMYTLYRKLDTILNARVDYAQSSVVCEIVKMCAYRHQRKCSTLSARKECKSCETETECDANAYQSFLFEETFISIRFKHDAGHALRIDILWNWNLCLSSWHTFILSSFQMNHLFDWARKYACLNTEHHYK